MSGHSKWSNIKHKKAKKDLKKAKIFTKIGKEILIALKNGGNDLEKNYKLKLAIIKARNNNFPQNTIKKLIEKSNNNNNNNYEELVYEGYGICGTAFLVEVITDNKNRTVGEIRHIFDKFGGKLGETGCVSWMFNIKGEIVIKTNNLDEDTELNIIELGVEDIINKKEEIIVYTNEMDFYKIKNILESKYEIKDAFLTKISKNFIKINNIDDINKLNDMKFFLEENDDVQNVYSNFIFEKI